MEFQLIQHIVKEMRSGFKSSFKPITLINIKVSFVCKEEQEDGNIWNFPAPEVVEQMRFSFDEKDQHHHVEFADEDLTIDTDEIEDGTVRGDQFIRFEVEGSKKFIVAIIFFKG